MTAVQLLPDSNQLGVKTNYAIYFTTKNELPKGSFVEITFPKGYFTNLSEVTCSAVKTASSLCVCKLVPGTDNVIRIENAFTSTVVGNTEIAFLLWNVLNPSSSITKGAISSQFSVMTVSPQYYPIDAANNLDFSIGCVFPCETCASDQKKCLTCLKLADGTPLNYFEKDQTCLLECPTGYRKTNANVCEKCDPLCATCSKSASFCDSCARDLGY